MKERIKKFYLEHEEKIDIILTTAGITSIVVAIAVASASAKDHKIVNVDSLFADDREILLITKKNGHVTTNFSRPLKTE